ncbi:D-serine deaminase, pyridoxal phosphate-dependent [Robiginitalea myxolifaciens]|uniref:D-serine deaminase, pyridoxal phosphate-dependent n=1 Tax=Robiginitalea myxolifaciens TaxID=400055 RepID=A0A1I6G965_9FLAO|nr:D-TA family PLP-dependent enzyme [Robiginitalea myxolifaciens]SFR38746.1 D-serine deaminase, pyridoxal phosphate-dependent [Robiginitalea myxolifaciens]
MSFPLESNSGQSPESLPWYALNEPEKHGSPALLVYPERIRHNIRRMITLAGSPDRLRPHVKTHKTKEIVAMQLEAGIDKFKCATLSEAEMLAECGVNDILLAYQPVGPDQMRLLELFRNYPDVRFAALVDNTQVLQQLGALWAAEQRPLGIYLDLNTGMNRTGVTPGKEAAACYMAIRTYPGLEPHGFHAYDGHLRNPDPSQRQADSDQAFKAVVSLRESLEQAGYPVPVVIAGGSPSFPTHLYRESVILSPGTTLLWDARYGSSFPEMGFLPAAVLLTRIISKPAPGILCLDLGHKAIAPEMQFPRVALLGLENSTQTGQSEEHLVVAYEQAENLAIGQEVYGIPMHICPTVAKYPQLLVVENHAVTDSWKVAARDYQAHI